MRFPHLFILVTRRVRGRRLARIDVTNGLELGLGLWNDGSRSGAFIVEELGQGFGDNGDVVRRDAERGGRGADLSYEVGDLGWGEGHVSGVAEISIGTGTVVLAWGGVRNARSVLTCGLGTGLSRQNRRRTPSRRSLGASNPAKRQRIRIGESRVC